MVNFEGLLTDFSINEGKAILDFPLVPGGRNYGFIDIGNDSIYILKQQKTYLWTFDSKAPIEVPDLRPPMRLEHFEARATQNGVFFYASKLQTWIFNDGKWSERAKHPKELENTYWACATFIPNDDNNVYLTGGFKGGNLDTVYRYSIKDDTYEKLSFALDDKVRHHACAGYINEKFEEFIIVISATRQRIYSLTDESKNAFNPKHGINDHLSNCYMTVWNGYLFIAAKHRLYRTEIEGNGTWVELGAKPPKGEFAWLMPFNV